MLWFVCYIADIDSDHTAHWLLVNYAITKSVNQSQLNPSHMSFAT